MDNIRSYKEFARETYIKERVEEIANAITKNDVEYKKWAHKENQLFEIITDLIGEDNQQLLDEYSTAIGDKFCRLIDGIVEQIINDIGKFE